jgi:hypothetical protein
MLCPSALPRSEKHRTNFFENAVGERAHVEAIIALPGWNVKQKGKRY